jgi:hypothetical protein
MRQEARASVFNLMACVAAFVFVALVATFGVTAGSRRDDGCKCCCRRAGDTGAGACG